MVPDAAEPPAWLQPGLQIGSGERRAYRLGPRLHEGETAWLQAIEDEFGRSLVLKLLRPQPSQGEPVEQQWRRERRLLERVHHPGVVCLHEAFVIDGYHALVLERGDCSLEAWISRHGPMPEPQLRRLAGQLLEALAAIHQAGVIHLDVSPDNVLLRLTPDGQLRPLIADFGIGVLEQDEEELDRPEGTWVLLPPEFLRPGKHRPTRRCDLYSLGHTLLFALRGSLPISCITPSEEVEQQLLSGLYRQLAASLETPFGQWLVALLEVDPARRPATALEAWQRLQALG